MSVYLDGSAAGYPSLAAVCAGAGLVVVPTDGWERRARSSGGFPDVGPMGVVIHHTASPASSTPGRQFSNDLAYCSTGHPDAPVGNLVLGPEGQVGLVAGGAANTQGKGGPWTTSRGVVPLDTGNSRLIAIEASNDGLGQPWPAAQCNAYVALVSALCDAYRFRRDRWDRFASDVLSHAEWTEPSCPGRKADPAGPAVGRTWAPYPTGGVSANRWTVDNFRRDLTEPAPLPPPEEDPMLYLIQPSGPAFPAGYTPAWFVAYASGLVRRATNADVEAATAMNLPTYVLGSLDQYVDLLAVSGSTYPPPA